MGKTSVNLQDSFLNQVRKDNSEVKIVMVDGSYLSGFVRGFDNFTIILNSKGSQHLIYKHAVAQLISRRQIQKGEEFDKKPEKHIEAAEEEVVSEENPPSIKPPKAINQTNQTPAPKRADNFNPIDVSQLKK